MCVDVQITYSYRPGGGGEAVRNGDDKRKLWGVSIAEPPRSWFMPLDSAWASAEDSKQPGERGPKTESPRRQVSSWGLGLKGATAATKVVDTHSLLYPLGNTVFPWRGFQKASWSCAIQRESCCLWFSLTATTPWGKAAKQTAATICQPSRCNWCDGFWLENHLSKR